ncbi:TetR/AcrR family transcriptional regulator [Allokutzneria sp. NRRL B-24872]|uniref:TetR/AcrR family transcriptional regulator n=1 Tax=Allokutzneria sp. NRRL B-24872 TaxID=1137961 RepID=UPI000A3B854D|nr:TetR family transcriptional regulator [Allokutzneria sp. NRRL B-24872]
MDEPTGLRELKKRRTREAISNTAIELFFEHGFDQVSISRIAEEAEVSRRTLFAYFPTKEDLVLHRIADHETETARVVADNPDAPLAALRAHFLDGLERRDPITGLCDAPEPVALYRLLLGTPSLAARMFHFREAGEQAVADALAKHVPALTARFAAAQIMVVQWRLSEDNYRAVAGGTSADDAHPAAVDAATLAFDMLGTGLGAALSRG